MALTIKPIPILTGRSASIFNKKADERAKLVTPHLTKEQEKLVDRAMQKSRMFKW